MNGHFLALVAAAALTALPARADPTDAPPTLEAAAANPSEKQSSSSFFLLQRNWSEIQPGTPKERVDALLGKPERVMRINGDLVWYYVYPGLGRGSVFFSAEGKVAAAQPPRLGWSW